jgi:predicted nucleotidyltransferase/HEPN domain-containing protein
VFKSKRIRALPEKKQKELAQIVSIILSHSPVPVHFIILFGSYARGKWADHVYTGKDGVTYSYQSDYDLLVLIDPCDAGKQSKVEHALDKALDDYFIGHHHPQDMLWKLLQKTPVSLLIHDIQYVNKRLSEQQYFFSDIKREGIILHDSQAHKLAPIKNKLHPKQRYQFAVEDFDYWFTSANHFYDDFTNNLLKHRHAQAAFLLHQATERLYHTLLLVYTHYKPRTHDLRKLKNQSHQLDERLVLIMPTIERDDKRLFDLLRRAYTEARYNKNYRINADDLRALQARVELLRDTTRQLCEEKIAELKAGAYPAALTSDPDQPNEPTPT